jgi:uncharacterized NAD(P)/FAD-binding protein YdhS
MEGTQIFPRGYLGVFFRRQFFSRYFRYRMNKSKVRVWRRHMVQVEAVYEHS